ncbi:glycosyltransferase [Butyrivibrio sp.]|jgi:glycosyltransferase involved in cell wall biosynthesis|uniref:glycosyltransferase n=1 Tax=Butyrivibrio sp. TaxID=28121 RepID=UPI0025C4410B|nr:glycosyltransferase [Butyrivibrio sp.]MBE5838008.1 glycosyltransferase family 1 protein [Butyrivibrio sp.]
MKKKILVVITTGFTPWGGITTSYMNYFRPMNKNGLIIDVASMNEAQAQLVGEIEDAGGKYIKLPDKRKDTIRYILQYSKLCKNYDVVHVHGNSPTMYIELHIAKVNRVPVRIAHSHNSCGMHPFLNSILKNGFNRSYTKAIACSKEAGRWLYTREFIVLNNVIDTSRFSFSRLLREKAREELRVGNDEILIGTVGKLVQQKNHIFLLDVFRLIHARYPNTKLVIVGDGILRGEIEKKISQIHLKDDVILAGMRTDTELFYSAMDFFFLPSLFEGAPIALMEAQAAGLSCLCSDNVTKECDVSGNVEYVALELNFWLEAFEKIYCNQLTTREEKSREAKECLKKSGYDNVENSAVLRNIYASNYFNVNI